MKIRIYIKMETLVLLLMKRGWTQEMLARRLGVSGAYVSMVMNRRYSPSPALQSRILDVFKGTGLRPGHRLGWDDMFQPETIESNTTHGG